MPKFRAVLITVCVAMAACGGAAPSATVAPSATLAATATPLSGKLTVFAAASLTESFTALAKEFTAHNPGVTATPSYAGSSALVTQIVNGAPADVFASADEPNMQKLIDAKLNLGDTKVFANNTLQIAV